MTTETEPLLIELSSLPHESHCPFGAMGTERERQDGCACITREIVDQLTSEPYRKAVIDRIREQATEIKSLRATALRVRVLCKESLADDLIDHEAREFAESVLHELDKEAGR